VKGKAYMSSKENTDTLLKEYGFCDDQIGRLDSLIWQTASLIYPISLGGFAYFGTSSTHTPDRFFSLLAVATGSITLILIWYLLSRLWLRFQSIAFYRMVEIEDEIGSMWRFRYSSFLGIPNRKRNNALSKLSDEQHSRFKKLEDRIGDFRGVGLRPAALFVTLIFILGWLAITIREYVLTFL
jgi:hypothetical protein